MIDQAAAGGADGGSPAGDTARETAVPALSVSVVAAAIVDDLTCPRRLLAARRSAPADLAGRWELPGGKIEAGEGSAQALHRELSEELGVRVRLGPMLPGPVAGSHGPAWQVSPRHLMTVYLAQLTEGEPVPLRDHDRLRWLSRNDLFDVDWLPGDLPIAAALASLMGAGL